MLIEGFLGELDKIELIEDIMFELRGTFGILRFDLTREELGKIFRKEREIVGT